MSFIDLGIHTNLLSRLKDLGYTRASPAHVQIVPTILDGGDILVTCQSGSAYTDAALIALLHRCIESPNTNSSSVIVCPTDNRAAHTAARLRLIVNNTLAVNIVSGNNPENSLDFSLPLIRITTPNQFLEQLQTIEMSESSLKTLLITQMDVMIAQGAKTALFEIGNLLTNKTQVILYTGRETRSVTHLTKILQHEPVRHAVTSDSQRPESTAQQTWPVPDHLKTPLLLKLYRRFQQPVIVVIVSTNSWASRLARRMRTGKSKAAALLTSSPNDMQSALRSRFGSTIKILIVPKQIPANLKVTEVTHVVHYDLPNDTRQYFKALQQVPHAVHISLVTPQDEVKILEIEDSIGRPLFRDMLADFDYSRPDRKNKTDTLSKEDIRTSRRTGTTRRRKKPAEKKTQWDPEIPRSWGDRNTARNQPEKIPLAQWSPEPLPAIWHKQETSSGQSSDKDNKDSSRPRHRRRRNRKKKGRN